MSPVRMAWHRRAGPSWLIAGVIYAGWALITWFYIDLPWWLVFLLGGFLLAWHGSLQHEAVHGQFAPQSWLNDLIALPPLGLWLPFPIYAATHRAHHDFEILTEPWRDPESFYVDQTTWGRLPPPVRGLLRAHNTLLGRLVLGPFLIIGQFLWAEGRALARKNLGHLTVWLWHVPLAGGGVGLGRRRVRHTALGVSRTSSCCPAPASRWCAPLPSTRRPPCRRNGAPWSRRGACGRSCS